MTLIRDSLAGGGKCQPDAYGTKLEDLHALMEAVMRPALRRYLYNAGVVDAELFAKQGAIFVKPVVL